MTHISWLTRVKMDPMQLLDIAASVGMDCGRLAAARMWQPRSIIYVTRDILEELNRLRGMSTISLDQFKL